MVNYIAFPNQMPIYTPIIPIAKLNTVYTMKLSGSPCFKNKVFSCANVEKVVNPPQNPVASSSE